MWMSAGADHASALGAPQGMERCYWRAESARSLSTAAKLWQLRNEGGNSAVFSRKAGHFGLPRFAGTTSSGRMPRM